MSAEQIKELKVRIFDLSEALQERQNFETQFFTSLAELLQLPEDMRSNPDSYYQAVASLKAKVSVEDAKEEATE